MLDRAINWWTSNIPPWAIIALVVHGTIMLTVAYLILLERKVASWVQDRLGPNRVGLGFGIIPIIKDWKMNGFGQPLADGVKFILKEDYRPAGADKVLFTIAPGLMVLVIIVSIAVLPWGGIRQTDGSFTSRQAKWSACTIKPPPNSRRAMCWWASRFRLAATITA